MLRKIRRFLLVALIGGAAGWWAATQWAARIAALGPPGETQADVATEATDTTGTPEVLTPAALAASIPVEDVIAVEEITGLTPVIVAPPPSDAGGPEPLGLPPVNTPVAEVAAGIDPVTAVAEPAEAADLILAELLNPTELRCEFGAGGGGNWPAGALSVHDADWQGGPIGFQAVNLDAGTARMVGSVDATDSLEGSIATRVIATPVGLHFLALTANGHLITTTVFTERDETGRFVGVMSRHEGARGPLVAEGTHFFGACD